jgi:DNA-binding LytR/AlgR family response regulator
MKIIARAGADMISIAVVEDTDAEAELLAECIKRYLSEIKEQFTVARFCDAESFLKNYRSVYDVVFMDIKLPNRNGMQAAFRLRDFDKQVLIIFVTNMVQFAVKGYEVDALDYIVKPIIYEEFKLKMQKTVDIIKINQEVEIAVPQVNGIVRLSSRNICYIDVYGHRLGYHTLNDTVYGTGSLSELEKKLKERYFMRCNSCYLVNPKYIVAVRGYTVKMLNGAELKISQPKKKKFMDELTDWLGQGNGK